MGLASNLPSNTRTLTDVNFVVTKSLSSATASAAMDLVQAVPYPVTEHVIVKFGNSLLSSSFTQLTSSLALQHSDASTGVFTDIEELAPLVVKSVTSNTSIAAGERSVLLPPSVKRYIRVNETATSASAALSNVTGSITASLLF